MTSLLMTYLLLMTILITAGDIKDGFTGALSEDTKSLLQTEQLYLRIYIYTHHDQNQGSPQAACFTAGRNSGRGNGYSLTSRRLGTYQTTSSADMSSGLTYSNPSNSVWSILPMMPASSGVSCTGSSVNSGGKFVRSVSDSSLENRDDFH